MRRLYVDENLCKGCTNCLLACSLIKEGECRPAVARLDVIRDDWKEESLQFPVVCNQCGKCARACPINAISKTSDGVYRVDETMCDGCGDCIDVCPEGVIFLHPESGQAVKCDFCDGNPECVVFCPFGALAFEEQATIKRLKRQANIDKVTAKAGTPPEKGED